MSKADGQYIAIKFTVPITSDPAGRLPTPVGGSEERAASIASIAGSSEYSGSYDDNFIDGNTSTYWRTSTTTGQYAIFTLAEARTVIKFRLYVGNTTYRPTTFTLKGSNDGTNYTTVLSGTCTSSSGWQEFSFENATAYLYYRMDITGANSSRLYMYEAQLIYVHFIGNEQSFTVTGQEYNFVPGGELEASAYTVESVAAHPTEENAILLTIAANDRFESVVGNLTVAYDATKGNLAGAGGQVESFSVSFTPADLVAKPNQNDQENIEIASIAATCTLTHIDYINSKEDENIEIAGITATGILTHVDDI
jgi:hypothetical protein